MARPDYYKTSRLGTPSPNPYHHGESLELDTYTSDDIVSVSNWGYWYEAKGRKLADMELDNAVFQFPDGSSAGGRLEVGSYITQGNDMGHSINIGHETLWLVIERNGQSWKTPWKPGDQTTFTWAECRTPPRR